MAALLDLPVEVIFSIADHLDYPSSCQFRLTCRGINQTTLYTFAQKNFSTRSIILKRRSLERLISIAEHPIFGPAVRTLTLHTYHLDPIDSICQSPTWYMNDDEDDKFEAMGFYDEAQNHEILAEAARMNNAYATEELLERELRRRLHNQKLLTRGLDCRYLTRAMRRLSNCRNITITDKRDPWEASFGSVRFIKHAVDVVLKAVAASNLPVERFDLAINSLQDVREPFSVTYLDFLPLVDPDNRRIDSLTHLSVSFCSSSKRQDLTANTKSTERPPQWKKCFVQFLALFPRLESLFLEVSTMTEHNMMFSIVSRLPCMPGLRRVELVAMEFRLPGLMSFLSRHGSTLEEIVLRKIVMSTADDWDVLMQNMLDMPRLNRLNLNRAFARQGRLLHGIDESKGLILVTDKLKSTWSAAQASKVSATPAL